MFLLVTANDRLLLMRIFTCRRVHSTTNDSTPHNMPNIHSENAPDRPRIVNGPIARRLLALRISSVSPQLGGARRLCSRTRCSCPTSWWTAAELLRSSIGAMFVMAAVIIIYDMRTDMKETLTCGMSCSWMICRRQLVSACNIGPHRVRFTQKYSNRSTTI